MSALRMTMSTTWTLSGRTLRPTNETWKPIEQTSAVSEQTRISDRQRKLSRLNILAPVVLGMLEILPSIECDVFLSSF